jgi:hypothetical protein
MGYHRRIHVEEKYSKVNFSKQNEAFMVIVKGRYKFFRKFGEIMEHSIEYRSSLPIGIDNPLYHTFRLNDDFHSSYPVFSDLIYREEDAKRMVEFLKENADKVLKEQFSDIEYITYRKYKLMPVAEGEE